MRIAPPSLPLYHSDPAARDFQSSIPVEALSVKLSVHQRHGVIMYKDMQTAKHFLYAAMSASAHHIPAVAAEQQSTGQPHLSSWCRS